MAEIWAVVASGLVFTGDGSILRLPGVFPCIVGGGTGVGTDAGANGVGVGTGRNLGVLTGGVDQGVASTIGATGVGAGVLCKVGPGVELCTALSKGSFSGKWLKS